MWLRVGALDRRRDVVMCFSESLVTKEMDQDEQGFMEFLTYQFFSLVLSLRLP